MTDPIQWGEPDRALGRGVCESIMRVMPHTPWHPPVKTKVARSIVGWSCVVLACLIALSAAATVATP